LVLVLAETRPARCCSAEHALEQQGYVGA
jgi:hypothetical protein